MFCKKGKLKLSPYFFYIGYIDDTTFFLNNENSVAEILRICDFFPPFSFGLTAIKLNCETPSASFLKGVYVALYEMNCISLGIDAFKILGI